MDKYLVIYHLRSEWPMSGVEEKSLTVFFNDADAARSWADDVFEEFEDCTDVQLYEYTGIQYVLIGRCTGDA